VMVMLVTPAGTVHVATVPVYAQVTVAVVATTVGAPQSTVAPAGDAVPRTDQAPMTRRPVTSRARARRALI
jgi:hypothetical protein